MEAEPGSDFSTEPALSSQPETKPESSEATLAELESKLAEEGAVYGELLAALDRLSENPAPYDRDPEIPKRLEELNRAPALDVPDRRALPGGLRGLFRRIVHRVVEPELSALELALDNERSFNSTLVQFLNRFSEATNRVAAREAELTSTVVRFAQRIDRLADAKDRLYASLGNRRADLLIEAMDKRLMSVRLGLTRAQERLEGLSSSVALARAEIVAPEAAVGRKPEGAAARADRFADVHYLAFENRFRGSSEELGRRLRDYVPYFDSHAPVLDLGCGRGEFLELLRDSGIEALGIDGNREMVHACRDRGLQAEVGDLIDYLEHRDSGSAGGIFAAQVVEHLPPQLIRKVVAECHRVLRDDGRLILETVNPKSLLALVESFYRDLTHQKPLHPDTLDFLLRAVGFREVETRFASPVSERARLLAVPAETAASGTLNQNFEKLNAILFGDQDYAAIGTK